MPIINDNNPVAVEHTATIDLNVNKPAAETPVSKTETKTAPAKASVGKLSDIDVTTLKGLTVLMENTLTDEQKPLFGAMKYIIDKM